MEYTPAIKRCLDLPRNHSFFLFGARTTGKTTLIHYQFSESTTLFFDLLDSEQEMTFARSPAELYRLVKALPAHITHIVIDEIQKVPKLLDEVHRLMQDKTKYFIMTCSSARKLKQGGANLLAGRAFVYNLFPISFVEQKKFDLHAALEWGTLPEIYLADNDLERKLFLRSYAHTYLKEEIWGEHLIRKLDPFRRFLEIAAQCNGQIINMANIARDVNVDAKTVATYFQILEDTLIGFFLEPYHLSVRKRQSEKPKFYFLDTGVVRALTNSLSIPLQQSTHAYGNAFEHYIMTECIRLGSYFQPEFRFSYIRTPSSLEVDLVIERPGKQTLLVEIKSTTQVSKEMLSGFIRLSRDIKDSQAICLSNDSRAKVIENITVFPWQEGLKNIFILRAGTI